MKVVAILSVLFCSAYAGHIGLVGPGTHGTVLHGPGSKTSLVGPDGSHIAAATGGGTVVAPPQHGGAVAAAVSPGIVAHAAPVIGIVHAAPVVGIAHAGLAVGPWGHAGSGLEGQWVPDYTEQLYDDGSYKGDYDGHWH